MIRLNKIGVNGTFEDLFLSATIFDLKLNTRGEGGFLYFIDIEARRYREQIEVDILVVYTVNDEY